MRRWVEKLRGWSAVDEQRDDMYAGFECAVCGFNDGGEILRGRFVSQPAIELFRGK
jgi:hypothetical protein